MLTIDHFGQSAAAREIAQVHSRALLDRLLPDMPEAIAALVRRELDRADFHRATARDIGVHRNTWIAR